MPYRFIGIALAAVLFVGCASEFNRPSKNELGYLSVADDAHIDVSVNQGVDTNQYRKLLYVQTEMHGTADWYAYQDYIMQAFIGFDFFDEVITRRPTVYINTTPPTATQVLDQDRVWFDVTDSVPIRSLRQQYGYDFMIAKATLRNKSPSWNERGAYYFDLQLIEGRTGKVVWQGSKEGKDKLGIDVNVVNPVLNYARGYLLHYDPTFVSTTPPQRSLAQYFETWTEDPYPNIGWEQ